ncbi:MAG: glutaredoxin domain-containing protein [Candidatus Micrarchaeota archaeon]
MVSDNKELETARKKKIEGTKDAGAKREPEVIVYSTPDCPYCTMAKTYLSGKGVKFTEYDVSKDQSRAKEMVMKSQQTAVPVLQINGRIIVGFDRQLIDDSLKKAPPPKREELLGNLFYDPFSI